MSTTTWEPWEPIYTCDQATVDATDETALEALRRLGQSLLWGLTGRRFGWATTTDECYYPAGFGECCVGPWHDEFGWLNRPPIDSGHDCCQIGLDNRPVIRVDEVRVNGVVLDASLYRLNTSNVMRLGACWPRAAACDDPPVCIDYTWGIVLPDEGKLALGEFMCEGIKGLTGQACRLPGRLVANVRQGTSQQFESAQDYIANGLIGLPLGDAWIRAVNPARLVQRSRVYSPDLPRRA